MSNLTNTNVSSFTTLIKPNIIINDVCEPVTPQIMQLVLDSFRIIKIQIRLLIFLIKNKIYILFLLSSKPTNTKTYFISSL